MLKHDDAHFSVYPTNRVVGFFDARVNADKAVSALKATGFDDDDIDESFGEDGLHFLDPDGEHHGVWGKLVRTWQNFANGSEKKLFDLIRIELGKGHVLVSAPVETEEERYAVGQILKDNSAHDIRYYGRLVVEDLEPNLE